MISAKMALRRQLLLFACSGVVATGLDAIVVQALVLLGGDPYLVRLPSYLLAMSFTYAFNRRFTFAVRGPWWPGWWRYGLSQLGGFALNYAVYASLLLMFPLAQRWPALAVLAGSLAGMLVNFFVARNWVFKRQ